MKSAIEAAIQTLAQKAMFAYGSAEALQYAQAVHSLANALSTLCHAEGLQRAANSSAAYDDTCRTSSIGRAIDFQSLG